MEEDRERSWGHTHASRLSTPPKNLYMRTDELPVHSLVPTLRAKGVEGGGYY